MLLPFFPICGKTAYYKNRSLFCCLISTHYSLLWDLAHLYHMGFFLSYLVLSSCTSFSCIFLGLFCAHFTLIQIYFSKRRKHEMCALYYILALYIDSISIIHQHCKYCHELSLNRPAHCCRINFKYDTYLCLLSLTESFMLSEPHLTPCYIIICGLIWR